MSTKTSKVLHIIAFILIFLTMAFVIVGWLMFRPELINLVSSSPELSRMQPVPWENIIEVGFVLLLALIWLIVLLAKPGRGATITMTIIISLLLAAYYAVGGAYLQVFFMSDIASEGAMAIAAYSSLKTSMTICTHFALVPGITLMLLSLGGACGKNFKKTAEVRSEEQPDYDRYRQPVQQPDYGRAPQPVQQGYGRQDYGQQPQYGAVNRPEAAYGAQQYARPQWQQPNTGYAPRTEPVSQNTGYIPRVEPVNQNTGYIPKVEPVSQNTGYIPKVEPVTQNTGYSPADETLSNTGTLPRMDEYADYAQQIPEPKPAAQPEQPVIYPWQLQAGAPEADKQENNE